MVYYTTPNSKNSSLTKKKKKKNLHSFSDYIAGWSKELQPISVAVLFGMVFY